MPLIEPVIRPPAEAGSFLLQITSGCSANQCSFCGAYLGKEFKIKDFNEISGDIVRGAQLYPETRRVFLIDGDALVVPNKRLLPVLDLLNDGFSMLTRVSSYANGYNITGRSTQEVSELRKRKLSLIYMGLESGSQEVLNRTGKRSGVEEMIEAVNMAAVAGIKSSVIVLLGLGGRAYSRQHIEETAAALNRMQPGYLSFLSVMLIPGTDLYSEAQAGKFEELNAGELLAEARDIIKELELKRTVFRMDHASNYLPLEGRFPKDKDKLIRILDRALRGDINLRPEFLRGL